jgi:hypothetical protein
MINGKTDKELWFDNNASKPPLIDDLMPYSVLVFFKTEQGYYVGQFDYSKHKWILADFEFNATTDGYIEESCADQSVISWMHIPECINKEK